MAVVIVVQAISVAIIHAPDGRGGGGRVRSVVSGHCRVNESASAGDFAS